MINSNSKPLHSYFKLPDVTFSVAGAGQTNWLFRAWYIYCGYCAKDISQPDYRCCPLCGRVVDEDNFLSDPTFVKDAAGQDSDLIGSIAPLP